MCVDNFKFANKTEWLRAAFQLLKPKVEAATGKKIRDVPVWCQEIPPTSMEEAFFKLATGLGVRAGSTYFGHTAPYTNGLILDDGQRDSVQAIGVLAHEMIHHALDDGIHGTPSEAGHGYKFQVAMKKLGLNGDPRATGAGPEFAEMVKGNILPVLGPVPKADNDGMDICHDLAI